MTGFPRRAAFSVLACLVMLISGALPALARGSTTTASGNDYSTSAQWNQVMGNPGAAGLGKLAGLPDWIPRARTLSAAQSNCSLKGFTGVVTITQWFAKPYDADYACKV
jgi:hypothetical protein